ncbi:MAG: DUF853 family protein [Planctomycetaceae bacterium]|nr:DUF853 family protein [Planctomycetaceae bacterium]
MTSFIPPIHFTVTQIRLAATCPRILYFDADDNRRHQRVVPVTTRIWEGGSSSVAGGTLFHNAVEKFNRLAAQGQAIRDLLETAKDREQIFRGVMEYFTRNALNRQSLSEKPAELIHNFSNSVEVYFGELSDIMHYGRESGRSAGEIVEQLFAPLPKRVDVTFHVGPRSQPVHITGKLDYVFFDWRSKSLRILDYKLTPATNPNNDQFQVIAYALLYHHQHRYECDAGVFYLHPKRELVQMSWQEVYAARHKLYDLLASMADWAIFDSKNNCGIKPPGNIHYCEHCRWAAGCENRLGQKSQGESHRGWSQSTQTEDPKVVSIEPQISDQADEILSDEVPEKIFGGSNNAGGSSIGDVPPSVSTKLTGRRTAGDNVLLLGRSLSGAQNIEIATPNLSTHSAIVGAAGSGKTWIAKVFIEEAILQGVPVLAIDPQGDLVQFLKQQPPERIPPEERKRHEQFRERVEPRIYTPGTSHGLRLSLSPIRLPREDDLNGLPPARRKEEFDAIVNSMATHLVALTLKGKRSVEQQQTFLSQILKALIRKISDRPLNLTDIAAAAHTPEDVGIEDAELLIRKTERENLGRQLYALAHGPLARLFSGGQTLDVDSLKLAVQPGKVALNVVYLNALNDPEKHAFLAAMATELYRWMSCSGGDPSAPQLLFTIDEARDFLPAGSSEPPAKRPVSRLFTQARKFGVGCLVCTQSPRSVDYNVFGNCSTKIIGRLETPQDSDRVGEWFTTTGAKPDWVSGRAGADQGTFVARWPGQPDALEGAVFRSRHLYSLHEGAWSPERVEQEVAADPLHQTLRSVSS